MTTAAESRTYLPEEEVAGRFGEIVEMLSSHGASAHLVAGGETIELSQSMADLLVQVARAMRQGLAVTIAPHGTRLTTQEAADMLGISRSTLVRRRGRFPSREFVGTVGSVCLTCLSFSGASGVQRTRRWVTWWRIRRLWEGMTTILHDCVRCLRLCAQRADDNVLCNA